MQYTIKQASEKTGLTEHTIRFYDKMGLLPLLDRTPSGNRRFSDNDIEWIVLICCLKNSGMALEKIKEFMKLCLQGELTCEDRKTLLLQHKAYIKEQMKILENSLSTINYKIDNYKQIGVFHIDNIL